MLLLVTPRQFELRSELYHQLGSMISAGIGLPQALDMLYRTPPAWTFRQPLGKLLDHLSQGLTFTEALTRLGSWLPEFDVALLGAGEQSGRLDACFRLLSGYYAERAQMIREVLSGLAYPLLVVHMAIFIFCGNLATLVWQGQVSTYLWQVLRVLLPLYGAVFLLIYVSQSGHGQKWRSFLESITRFVPILSSGRRDLALARLSMALEALISAGVSIVQAWDLAAAASGSPALQRNVAAWRPQVIAGQTPAEAIRVSGKFPPEFTSLYTTGEHSGKLDDTLRQLHVLYQSSASRKLKRIAQWTPRLIYYAIAAVIGYQVIHFWTGYFDNITTTVDKAFGP